MAMADRVLIDTCIWAAVFARPNSPENQTVSQLIEDDRVVVAGWGWQRGQALFFVFVR